MLYSSWVGGRRPIFLDCSSVIESRRDISLIHREIELFILLIILINFV